MIHSRLVEDDSRKRKAEQDARNLVHRIILYSLFEKNGNRFSRISDMAYTEKLACRVFSERLAENPLVRVIKPIKIESLRAR